MKFSTFICLLLTVVSFGYGQNQFSGRVQDAENNTPIYNAAVYIANLEIGTVTDANGNFEFKNLPKGKYTLVCSILGYKSTSSVIEIPYLLKMEPVITLQPSAIEVDEVVVSTAFDKLQKETITRVSTLTQSQLKQTGALSVTESLEQIPGVQSSSIGIGIGKPVIRGLQGNRVVTYWQDIRLENQQFGADHGLGIQDNGIGNIEVIKGPATLLYGSDALGGVIYITPEKFAPKNSTKGSFNGAYFSNTLGNSLQASVQHSADKFKYSLSAKHLEHADYKTPNQNRVVNSRFSAKDIKGAVGYQAQNIKSTLRYTFTDTNVGIPEEAFGTKKQKSVLLPYQNIQQHSASLNTSVFLEKSRFNIILGYTDNKRREFEEEHHHHEEEHHAEEEEHHHEDEHHAEEDEHHEDEHHAEEEEHHEDEHHEDEHHEDEHHAEEHPALDMHLQTMTYNVSYGFGSVDRYQFLVGAQGMYQKNSNHGEEVLIPDANITDFGFYATQHAHYNALDVELGVRYDAREVAVKEQESASYFNKTYHNITGSLGVLVPVGQHLQIRAAAASGFRAPNLSELHSNGVHHGTNRFEIGDKTLKTEKNMQLDLDVNYSGKHLEFFASGFYNNVKDYIFLNPDGTEKDHAPVFRYTQKDAILYGTELGMHIHPHPLDWLHLESSLEIMRAKQKKGDYLALIPQNTLKNTLRVVFADAAKKQEITAFSRLENVFARNSVAPLEIASSGYSLLHAGASYSKQLKRVNLRLGVTVNNVLDKGYIPHLSNLKPDNITAIGRNVMVQLGANF